MPFRYYKYWQYETYIHNSTRVSFDRGNEGLVSPIEALIDTLARATDITFEVRLDAAAATVLKSDQQLYVYRIIQEAVHNMVAIPEPIGRRSS